MLAVWLGLVTGLMLGLTGAGGSVLALPLLMFGLGWTLPQAAPVALLAVCVSATIGTIIAWRQKIVRWRAALLMAFSGLFTAPLGLYAADRLPLGLLSLGFAMVLIIVAARLWRQAVERPAETRVVRGDVHGEAVTQQDIPCQVNPDGRLAWSPPCMRAIILSGSGSGFLSGLLGVGGGFVIVPSLRAVTTLPMHGAVATSLMTIALTSACTVTMAIGSGRALPWLIALPFAAGSLAGMLISRPFAARIAGPRLQRLFAMAMICVAAGMAFRSVFSV